MPKDTGEFIISKSMNLRLPPIFWVYRVFVYSPTSPVFAEPVTYSCSVGIVGLSHRAAGACLVM